METTTLFRGLGFRVHVGEYRDFSGLSKASFFCEDIPGTRDIRIVPVHWICLQAFLCRCFLFVMHGLRGLELYLAGCRGIVHTTPQGDCFWFFAVGKQGAQS